MQKDNSTFYKKSQSMMRPRQEMSGEGQSGMEEAIWAKEIGLD